MDTATGATDTAMGAMIMGTATAITATATAMALATAEAAAVTAAQPGVMMRNWVKASALVMLRLALVAPVMAMALMGEALMAIATAIMDTATALRCCARVAGKRATTRTRTSMSGYVPVPGSVCALCIPMSFPVTGCLYPRPWRSHSVHWRHDCCGGDLVCPAALIRSRFAPSVTLFFQDLAELPYCGSHLHLYFLNHGVVHNLWHSPTGEGSGFKNALLFVLMLCCQAYRVLMNSVPEHVHYSQILKELQNLDVSRKTNICNSIPFNSLPLQSVSEVHDLHIWSIASGKVSG